MLRYSPGPTERLWLFGDKTRRMRERAELLFWWYNIRRAMVLQETNRGVSRGIHWIIRLRWLYNSTIVKFFLLEVILLLHVLCGLISTYLTSNKPSNSEFIPSSLGKVSQFAFRLQRTSSTYFWPKIRKSLASFFFNFFTGSFPDAVVHTEGHAKDCRDPFFAIFSFISFFFFFCNAQECWIKIHQSHLYVSAFVWAILFCFMNTESSWLIRFPKR